MIIQFQNVARQQVKGGGTKFEVGENGKVLLGGRGIDNDTNDVEVLATLLENKEYRLECEGVSRHMGGNPLGTAYSITVITFRLIKNSRKNK